MAKLTHEPARYTGRDLVTVHGYFFPNGSSAPTLPTPRNAGITGVTWVSTGTFDIQFDETFYRPECIHEPTLMQGTVGDQYMRVATWTAATRKLRVVCWDVSGAAVADLAADPNTQVHFSVTFRTSNATGV